MFVRMSALNSCRLCGGAEANINIFSRRGTNTLSAQAMSCAHISIHPGDGLPEVVCEQCLYQLTASYRFKIQCETSEKYFRTLLSVSCVDITKTESSFPLIPKIESETDDDKVNCSIPNNEESMESFPSFADNNGLSGEYSIFESIKHSNLTENKEDLDQLRGNVKIEKNTEDSYVSDTSTNPYPRVRVRKNSILKPEILLKENEFEIQIHDKIRNCNGKSEITTNDLSKKHNSHSLVEDKIVDHTYSIDTKIKTYSCPKCNKIFSTIFRLNKHIIKHKKKKNTECLNIVDFVNYSVKTKKSKDELENKPFRKYMCDICGNTYNRKNVLQQHQATHNGVKSFSCDICQKSFTRRSHLDLHMRIHNNIKPFVCEICGFPFIKSSDLSRHKVIHSDVKSFSCKFCNKRFKRSNDVISHMRVHTGHRPYTCVCGKSYTSHSSLRKHKRANEKCVTKSKMLSITNNSDLQEENKAQFIEIKPKLETIEIKK